MRPRGRFRQLWHDWRVGVVVVLVWGAVVVVGVRGADADDTDIAEITLLMDRILPGRGQTRILEGFREDPWLAVVRRDESLVVLSDSEFLGESIENMGLREFRFRSDLMRSMGEDPTLDTKLGELLAEGTVTSRSHEVGVFVPSLRVRRVTVSVQYGPYADLIPQIEAALVAALGRAPGPSRGAWEDAVFVASRIEVAWCGVVIDLAGLLTTAWMPVAVSGVVRRVRRRGTGACVGCGYDLRGLALGVCSECGLAEVHAL